MDFPRKNFPYTLNQHGKQREYFCDYGSYCNIDMNEDADNLKLITQKRPQSNREHRLSAVRPTLPLYCEPEKASFPFKDRIMGELEELRRYSSDFVSHLKYRAGRNKKAENENEVIVNLLKTEETTLHIPDWLERLVDKYKLCRNVVNVKNSNSLYTGGCLTCFSGKTMLKNMLISPCGEDFNKLKISYIDVVDEDCKLSPVKTFHQDVGTPVYEVQGKQIYDTGYYAVRSESSVEVYRFERSSTDVWSPDAVHKMYYTNDKPTSVCISPYIPGECLVATDSGTVDMWREVSGDSRKEEAVKNVSHRFSCHNSWRQCSYGGHPRLVIMADNTVVQMFDLRRASREGVDLFALPSKLLHRDERVQVIGSHPVSSFLHIIATDFSLMLVDERFPGSPLLQWQHVLRTPPSYLSPLTNIGQDDDNLIIIASQNPPDVCCYTFSCRPDETPRALEPPWRISRFNDFTKWHDICGGTDKILVDDRLNTSLAGITAVPTDNGFTAYQLDSHGDIFYQMYEETNNEERDKSFTAGPGSQDISIDQFSIRIGKEFFQKLETQVYKSQKEAAEILKQAGTDVSYVYDEITIDKPAHVMCSLCMPGTKRYLSDVQQDEAVCHNCSESVKSAKCIVKSVKKDKILLNDSSDNDDEFDAEIEQVEDIDTADALSKIMVKLWHRDDDLKDLVIERDKEIKMRRKKKTKVKNDKSDFNGIPVVQNMESDLISKIEKTDQKKFNTVSRKIAEESESDKLPPNIEEQPSREINELNNSEDDSNSHSLSESAAEITCDFSNSDSDSKNRDHRDNINVDKISHDCIETKDSPIIRKRKLSGSSVSSLRSNLSSRSSVLPGFSNTPTRIKQSIERSSPSRRQFKNDITDTDDSEFFKTSIQDSLSMFPSQVNRQIFAEGQGQSIGTSPSSQKGRLSQTVSRSPSKTKRNFVSGF